MNEMEPEHQPAETAASIVFLCGGRGAAERRSAPAECVLVAARVFARLYLYVLSAPVQIMVQIFGKECVRAAERMFFFSSSFALLRSTTVFSEHLRWQIAAAGTRNFCTDGMKYMFELSLRSETVVDRIVGIGGLSSNWHVHNRRIETHYLMEYRLHENHPQAHSHSMQLKTFETEKNDFYNFSKSTVSTVRPNTKSYYAGALVR